MLETLTHSYKSDYFVATPQFPFMYLRILNENIDDLVAVFTNPEETQTITFNGERFDGYTKFVAISVEDTAYKICLERT